MEADREAFWELVNAEKDVLWRLARGLAGSYDEALDLTSETFLAAYNSFDSLRDPASFRSFLSTIAIRIHRRKRWRNRLFVSLEQAQEITYEVTNESGYDLDLLLEALTRLPLRQREAIILFEITGLTLKEIQQIQGGSVQGVKSRLNRARQTLKHVLADENLSLAGSPTMLRTAYIANEALPFKLDQLAINLQQP
ncbi:MAG TPA: RNA polymerase sigma factor [Candidatus Kapabacteria bacterium]|jgi:RNA polymerase sigma-70 factor (ECF subfamily)|nr:RNA polymerase sigma factor [Candidatus Kapabacteria bacterium]